MNIIIVKISSPLNLIQDLPFVSEQSPLVRLTRAIVRILYD